MDDNQWHKHDIMGVIVMELHSSWKWIVLIELQWVAPYIRWIVILQFMQFVH
jgi:hypothetical protein